MQETQLKGLFRIFKFSRKSKAFSMREKLLPSSLFKASKPCGSFLFWEYSHCIRLQIFRQSAKKVKVIIKLIISLFDNENNKTYSTSKNLWMYCSQLSYFADKFHFDKKMGSSSIKPFDSYIDIVTCYRDVSFAAQLPSLLHGLIDWRLIYLNTRNTQLLIEEDAKHYWQLNDTIYYSKAINVTLWFNDRVTLTT